jgi:hypothetical protein
MADIAVVAAQVAPVDPMKAEIRDLIAAAALTAGQPVYIDANGKAGVADGNGDSPANRFRGIALKSVAAGQPVPVLVRGVVFGFTVSGLAYDAAVYVSDTAGSLADAAGTTSLVAGRVVPLTDRGLTKVLYVTGYAG